MEEYNLIDLITIMHYFVFYMLINIYFILQSNNVNIFILMKIINFIICNIYLLAKCLQYIQHYHILYIVQNIQLSCVKIVKN